MAERSGYFQDLAVAIKSLKKGLVLTFGHLIGAAKKPGKARLNVTDPDYFASQRGIVTVQYPHEQLPVPALGRYQLHNEIDDCIVCDKCVKACPVNCITIEPIRSAVEFGKTSDGSPKKIYAAKFDIDMGKCCFCGLCTTVCPTECLTMSPVFNFSSYSMDKHYFKFGNLTEAEVGLRKKEWSDFQASKPAAVAPATTLAAPKQAMKPKFVIPKPPSAS